LRTAAFIDYGEPRMSEISYRFSIIGKVLVRKMPEVYVGCQGPEGRVESVKAPWEPRSFTELRDRRNAECGKRQTLSQMQIARPHHHSAFAVYTVASPHAVLRNGKIQPSKCQRLLDIPLGDQCRVKGVCLARLGEITGRA
jgi:hypothetical protein